MKVCIRTALLALVSVVVVVGTAGAATAPPFTTDQPSMLMTADRSDVEFTPIITVGETLSNGYRFEALPDGISLQTRGEKKVDAYVNHETSTVAFPYVAAGPTTANSQNDFDNSQLSLLTLSTQTAAVLDGKMAIASNQNFQRFCSNFLASKEHGFNRPTLLTNEEGQDWVFRSGTAWTKPIAPGTPGAEQIGVVVAHDVKNGQTRPIYGMGRHNHENSVAVPGYKNIVVISGDDTFSTTPASSQLYMYVAKNRNEVWNDKGTLYAFTAVDTTKNDYFDVQGSEVVEGRFAPVPKNIATGKRPDGSDITRAADFPAFPAPPASIPDGPQWVLDQWGNKSNTPTLPNDVFDFIRIEDTAYDKRPGMWNVHYLADSGRGTAGAADPLTTSTNGRIWKLELDKSDPTKAKLSILVQGDDNPVKTPSEIHQPDNLETTANGSLLVTEDPGSSQQFALPTTDPNATTARLWRVPLGGGSPEIVAKVDQSAEGGPTDVGPVGLSNWGAWESSGIVDASSVFGPGMFLVDVQAHTLWVEKDETSAPDAVAPPGPDWTFKREGGQLLLIKIPGA